MNGPVRLLFPVVLSLLAISAGVLNAWLITRNTSPEVLLLAIGIQTLVLAGTVWAGAALLELRVFRPLRRLRDHLGVFLSSDSDHRLAADGAHGLGDLPELIQELGRRLTLERRETARTMATVADHIDHRKSRLEAILRDLHEGVLVCNDEHRIVLFNQAAAQVLEASGAVGLHRPVASLLRGESLREQYADMKRQIEAAGGARAPRAFDEATVDGRPLPVRMSLIVEPDRRCSGYVLSFQGPPETSADARGGDDRILSDRPEFYDFSLFDAPGDLRHRDKPLDELDYVVFDTETTGLNPSGGDRIVQISAIRLVNGRVTGEVFDTLVNPGIPIPQASIRFHGITDDMVADAPTPADAAGVFRGFVGDAVMVAHNAAFDMKFLSMLEPEGRDAFDNAVLDTLLLSFVLQPSHSNHTLDAIAARFGVSIPEEARHTALGDARATAEVFVKMLPALQRGGVDTLGHAMEASNRVFHIRRQQEKF